MKVIPADNPPSVRVVDAAGIAACVLMLAGAYFVGLAPRLNALAEAERARADLDSGLRELADVTARRRERGTTAGRLAEQLRAGALRLSGAGETNRRIEAIVGRAKDRGLKIAEIVPGTASTRDTLVIVPITVRGVGGYAAVTDLLAQLRAEFPDTAVTSLALSGSIAGDVPPEFSVEFSWYTDPHATAVAATPDSRD